jgi:hypothetical protein
MSDTGDKAAERLARAMRDSQSMEDTRSYLSRGRSFESFELPQLHQIWARAYKAFLAEGDDSKSTEFADAEAELRLRSEEPPHDLVKPYWHKVRRRLEGLTTADRESVRREVRIFIDELDNKKDN